MTTMEKPVPNRKSLSGLVLTLCVFVFSAIPTKAQDTVDNPRPVWNAEEGFRFSEAPSLLIGNELDEMYQFFRVAGAARLSDGRIVVADGGSRSLRFFDQTGEFLNSVGRQGGGPGEFQDLSKFFLVAGDTIVAGDRRDLSYFSESGQYLMRRGGLNDDMRASLRFRDVVAAFDGSGLRVTASVPMRPEPRPGGGAWIEPVGVSFIDGDNQEVRSLGMLPGMEVTMSEGRPRPPWFGATSAFASDGELFYTGLGTEYSIRVFDRGGQLVRTIRRAWEPQSVSGSDIDEYVREWGKRWIRSTGTEAEAERRSLRADPYAERVPAFSQFVADRAGRLWVREANLADAPGAGQLNTRSLVPSTWSVFNSEGRWLGDVVMPARFKPTDIGADYVLGTVTDGNGVEMVAMFALENR